MLKYGLTERFVRHISHLPFDERLDILWKVQGLLSHVPGYLRLKDDGTEEDPIFKKDESSYILMHDDYESRILVDFAKNKEDLKPSDKYIEESIVGLLSNKVLDDTLQETFKVAIENHFPIWFINLLSKLPSDYQKMLMSKEEFKEEAIEEVKKEVPATKVKKATEVEQISKPIKQKPHKPKNDVDGAKFEKEILRQLAKGYELRKKKQKVVPNKPLSHVKFATKEIVIPFSDMGECLFLVQKRTTKYGCRVRNDDWKILLALSVEESIEKALERRYPGHVCYTDEPNKGDLRIAFIIKPKKEQEVKEDLGVKRVVSKTASFQSFLPSGAFENVDEDDIPEINYNSSFKPMVQKNVVHVSSEVVIEQIEEQMEEFFDDMFFDEEFEFDVESSPSLPSESEPIVRGPSHYHCHLCGKKKLYSGEPAETVKLASGKIVYLCAKHRGKM